MARNIKRNDMILVGCLIVIALVVSLLFYLNNNDTGNQVQITIDKDIYGIYDLSKDQEIIININDNYNKVIIKDNKVTMEEANCPDHYCEDYNAISKTNETIVCLPHKLVVEIINDENDDIDVVVK